MSKANDVEINLTVATNEAVAAVKKFETSFKQSFANIGGAIVAAQAAYAAVTKAISVVTEAVGASVKAAIEQEKMDRRVTAALRLKGDVTGETAKEILAFNAAIQASLGYGEEELSQIQLKLLAQGVLKNELKAATEATLGYAEATGKPMFKSIKAVAEAFNGSTAGLKGYGVALGDTTAAQQVLSDMFNQTKAQADTAAVQFKVLEANLGEVTEAFGFLILKSEVMVPLFELLNEAALKVQATLTDPAFVDGFKTVVSVGVEGLRKIAEVVTAMAKAYAFFAEKLTVVGAAVRMFRNNRIDVEEIRGEAETGPAKYFGPEAANSIDALADLRKAVPKTKKTKRKDNPDEFQDLEGDAIDQAISASMDTANITAKYRKIYDEARKEQAARHRDWQNDEKQYLLEQNNDQVLAQQEMYRGLAEGMAGVTTSAFSSMIQGVVAGTVSMGQAMGQFLGQIITQMGQFLIQLGTAAVMASALSWLFPPAALGAGAGAAAIAAGAIMVGVGTALSGAAGGSKPSPAPSSPRTALSPPAQGMRPELGLPVFGATSSSPVNVTVNFNGVVTNPRRAAREIEDVLASGRGLRLAGA